MANVMKLFQTICFILSAALAQQLCAQEQEAPVTPLHTDFDNYRVHHSVFNSRFLQSKAAAAYGFVRSDDIAIINIAVTDIEKGAQGKGLPIQLKGQVANLMQQSTEFDFVEISEGPEDDKATYYLAQFKFADKEILNFKVHVLLPGERYSKTLTFSKKLYQD